MRAFTIGLGLLLLAACTGEMGNEGDAGGAGSGSGGIGAGGGGAGANGAGGSGGPGGGGSGSGGSGGSGNGGSGGSVSTIDGCPATLPDGWLFCDDFETGDFSRWTEVPQDPARLRVDSAQHRSGVGAMYVPAEDSTGNQGGEATWRSWPTGYPELHARAWVRFAPDFEGLHHFLHLGAARRDDRWSADGLAGCRPTGENFYSLTLDLTRQAGDPPPGKALLYTYWPEMSCDSGEVCNRYADAQAICDGCASRDAPCENGLECCWGNWLEPAAPVVPPLDRWVCLEFSTRLNDPGQANGWAAFSIDGTEFHRRENMTIRDSDILELSSVRMGIYNTAEDAQGHANRAWLDDVVISTGPIGCN